MDGRFAEDGRVYAPAMPELIHTCYRIGDIDRSVAFYEALGFEEVGRMPIRDEAINVFMGLPGDGPRLELTYNFGVDAYELGTGYNHIAITAADLDATLARLAEQGIEAEKPPYTVQRGRNAPVLRARPRRVPDRAHRTWRLRTPGSRSSISGPTPFASSSSRSGGSARVRWAAGGGARTRSTSRCGSAPASTRRAPSARRG